MSEATRLPFATRQKLARIPCSINVNASCKQIYEIYEANWQAQLSKMPILSESERLGNFYEVLDGIESSMTDIEKFRIVKKAARTLSAREEKTVSASTPSVKKVIWYLLNNLCRKEFERLAKSTNPKDEAMFWQYVNGERKWMEVSFATEWLAEMADVSENGFRGNRQGAYYNSLERLEFGYRQTAFKKNGEPSPFAQDVILKINVYRFFFGYEQVIDIRPAVAHDEEKPQISALAPMVAPIFLPPSCGNSTYIETESNKNKEQSKKAASPIVDDALCSATEQAKGEVDCPQAAPAREICRTAPEVAASNQLIKMAEECLKLAFSTVFNDENLSKYRIRTNRETAITFVSPTSQAVCLEKMKVVIQTLKEQGMSFPAIGEAIIKQTTATAEKLGKGEKEYVYAPEMWLNVEYSTATLFSSISTKEAAKVVKLDIEKPKFVISNDKALFVQTSLAWIVDQNFHPRTLQRYVEKYGAEAVAYCGKWCQMTLASGEYNVKTTVARYINNKLSHLDPLSIKQSVMDLKEKLATKNPVKPGHILAKWVAYIVENTTKEYIRRAWQAAIATHFDGTTLSIQVKNVQHHQVLECDESITLFKAARQATGLTFKIEYTMQVQNS